MRRSLSLLSLLLLLVLPLVGCKDSTGPEAAMEGTYILQTVDGMSLPHVLWDDHQDRTELVSGAITLRRNGVWNDTHDFRVTDRATGEVTTDSFNDSGTFTPSGNNVTLESVTGDVYPAVWNDDEITVAIGALHLTYRK